MDWNIILKDIYNSKEYKILIKKIKEEYKTKTIYPSFNNVFKALELTPYKNVKAVIIGQDPYHGEGEANGLCFSVNKDIKQPPSLRNIFKELKSDLNIEATSNDLSSWAKEGVLLLNSCLTVIKDKPNSHKDIGWQFFTDNIISKLNERKEPIVFILWGNYAKTKKKLITNKNHLIIESSHPSPLGAYKSFFNSKPFSKTNNFLIKNNIKPINWEI
ncbi:MAG TPA: uracil-DNA glycosylase [Mollicutes bacterium]|nr:uracil-DNA glycosylase [Mollicutes bacterium]